MEVVTAGAYVMISHHGCGANVKGPEFVTLCIILCIATVSEWYEFTVYLQLSNILTALFFPAASQLPTYISFWVIYGIGFVSRPVGAIIFGHLGDAYGRRPAAVGSATITLLATVAMGCMPTYQQAGMAAPSLLAALRFVQGMAVGGQFGAAVVYLYEAAPQGWKGIVAAFAQQAVAPGIVLGMLACMAARAFSTPEEFLLWGWRVPFLAASLAAPLAVGLHMRMREPFESTSSRREMLLQRISAAAAAKVAKVGVARQPVSSAPGKRLSARQLAAKLQSVTKVVLSPVVSIDAEVHAARGRPVTVCSSRASHGGLAAATAAAAAQLERLSKAGEAPPQPPEKQKQHDGPLVTAAQAPGDAGAGVDPSNAAQRQLSFVQELSDRLEQYSSQGRQTNLPGQRPRRYEQKLYLEESKVVQALGVESEYVVELENLGGKIKRHWPLAVLLGSYWPRLWLQFLVEACCAATFYTFFSWCPSYLASTTSLSPQSTAWAIMAGLGLFMILAPVGGWLADRGPPKVWTLMSLCLGVSAVSIPVMFGLHSSAFVVVLLMVTLMLGACGCMGGLLTSIGPEMYPAGVRITGYALGHSLAMSIWGGLAPFFVSVISALVQPTALAAGILLVLLGVISWSAAAVLIGTVPHINAARQKAARGYPRSSVAAEAEAAAAAAADSKHGPTRDGAVSVVADSEP